MGDDAVEQRSRVGVWRLILCAILAAGFVATLVANWPGHFGPDALWQLGQGRSGVLNAWHPPVMAWLLGLYDRIIPGAPLFIVMDAALFYGALAAFALTARNPRPLALLLAALIAASPLVLIYQGIVWKDVLFADASLAGFAALAWAGRCWMRPPLRLALLLLALLLLALAGLSRQNGLVTPLCGAAGVFALALTREKPLRAAGYGIAVAALLALMIGMASAGLYRHSDQQPENLHQLKRLQTFDLAGMVQAEPTVDLPILHRDDPGLEAFVRTQAAPRYTPAGADNLELLPGAGQWLIPEGDAGGRQWRATILAHPLLYLRQRASAFGYVLMTPSPKVCPFVATGIGADSPQLMLEANLPSRRSARDVWDTRYAFAFLGTPVFSHLAYGALAGLLLALAGARLVRGDRRPEIIATIAMIAAALLFTASFAVIANACDYRYLYFLDVAAMAALLRQTADRGPVSTAR